MHTVLTVNDLSKQFRLHEQGASIPSCSGVSLEVRSGELTALVGPTGAGKSSVLKCIYRTYLASSGHIWYTTAAGERLDLASVGEHRMLQLRQQEIAFVTQFMHCLPRQGAIDVVAAPLVARGTARAVAHDRAGTLLTRLGVPERLWTVPPATFSGGEQQRVNLARGLVARPRLLLLDEPTASLDRQTTDRVVELLQTIKQEGVAMLAIFHHSELVARLAERVVELARPLALADNLETSR